MNFHKLIMKVYKTAIRVIFHAYDCFDEIHIEKAVRTMKIVF